MRHLIGGFFKFWIKSEGNHKQPHRQQCDRVIAQTLTFISQR